MLVTVIKHFRQSDSVWFNSSWENEDIYWSLEKVNNLLNPHPSALPFCSWARHLCLSPPGPAVCGSLTATDKMSVWMYANVIFVVHYSLKDRCWTISFPFMRAPCWPAEWRYSNYHSLCTGCAFNDGAPLPSVEEKLAYRRTAGEQLSSHDETSAILVKQGDVERVFTSGQFPAEVLHWESVWALNKPGNQLDLPVWSASESLPLFPRRILTSWGCAWILNCLRDVFILNVTHNQDGFLLLPLNPTHETNHLTTTESQYIANVHTVQSCGHNFCF